ncbi:MAG: hypothetical protein KGN84_22210 [Acidobacteriota bacterium]|nr:hypothetical protein [Acidobacteriota bacterium]
MFPRLALCAIATLALLPAASLQRFDKVSAETAAFAPGGTIRIEGSAGDLNVEGWDQPSVEVTVTRVLWSNDAARAKRLLDAADIEKPSVSGNQLTFRTLRQGRGGIQIGYRVRVPRDSRLVIHHGTGAVVVYDVAGDVDATAKVGDIVLQLPGANYAIDAKNKSGGEIHSDFPGALHFNRILLGERLNRNAAAPAHRLMLRVGVGGIAIQKMPANAD